MTIRIGETAQRLAACYGVDAPLPHPIPVWVADVNCEVDAYPALLVQLRSADGGPQADYADLEGGRSVVASSLFLRGPGYRSPETMTFRDEFGEFRQPGQKRS